MPTMQQVCAYSHEGISQTDSLNRIMKVIVEYCLKLQPVVQACLKEAVEEDLLSKTEDKMDEWLEYMIKFLIRFCFYW